MAVVKRVGDLVFDHLRRLPGHFGVDDDLHVGQVRQGIQRRLQHRIDARQGDEQGGEDDEELVPRRPFDEGVQHFIWPARRAS
jgi:hypothetical protein